MARVGNVDIGIRGQIAELQSSLNRASGLLRSETAKMRQSQRAMQRANEQVASSFRGITRAAGALGLALSIDTFRTLGTQALRAADNIAKTADRVGLTTTALQELRHASQLAGVESKTFDMAMQRLTRRLGEAAQGSGELLPTLQQYGIAITDAGGRTRATEAVLGDLADLLARTKDPAEQLRIAFKAFDSEGAALVNMLRGGSAALEETRASARRLGLVMGEETLRGAERLNDQITILNSSLRTQFQEGLLRSLVGNVEDLGDALADPKLTAGAGTIGELLGGAFKIAADEGARLLAQIKALQDLDVGGLLEHSLPGRLLSGDIIRITPAPPKLPIPPIPPSAMMGPLGGAFMGRPPEGTGPNPQGVLAWAHAAEAAAQSAGALEAAAGRLDATVGDGSGDGLTLSLGALGDFAGALPEKLGGASAATELLGSAAQDALGRLRDELGLLERLVPQVESGALSLEAMNRQRELAASLQALGIEQGSAEAQAYAETTRRLDALNDRLAAHGEAQRRAAQAMHAREAEAARDLERFADRSSTVLAQGLLSQWREDTVSFWETFKTIGLSALANFVAEAATQKLVVPIYARLVGEGGGAAGGAGGGGMPNIPGGGGLLDQFSGTIDSFGASLGFSPGVASTMPAAPVVGANGMLAGGGATSIVPGQVAAGSTFGTTTLSGFLGGAGAGFGAGMFLNSLVGGNSTGGTIGSAGGALAGAAIGSIIPGVGTLLGGLLGGAGGGLLGGLFGNNRPSVGPNSTARGLLYGGEVGLTDLGADNEGDAEKSIELLKGLAQALDQVNAATLRDIGAQEARFTVMEKTGQITVEAAGQTAVFTDEAEAVLFATKALVGNFAGLDKEMERVVKEAGSLEQALANLESIKAIDSLRTVFVEQTQAEQQVAALRQRYGELAEAAERLNLSEARRLRILEAEAAELAHLARDFEGDLARQLLAGVNPLSAALEGLGEEMGETARSAAALGVDIGLVTELFGQKLLQAVQQATDAQLRAIEQGSQLERSLSAFERARRRLSSEIEAAAEPFAAFSVAARTFRDSLQQTIDGLRTDSSLSPLSPAARLAEARGIFARVLGQARGGDAEALGRIGQDARVLLEASRAYNASGPGFAQDFAAATAALEKLGVDLGAPVDVAEQQLAELRKITDLLAQPRIDLQALGAALSAAGLDTAAVQGLVGQVGKAQASAEREIGHSSRDALQEQYATLRDLLRDGGGSQSDVAAWAGIARQLIAMGSYSRQGVNDDGRDIAERGFDVPAFRLGGVLSVPPGFGGDSFPMLAQSGERVTVERPDQVGRSEALAARQTAAVEENTRQTRRLYRLLLEKVA